MRAPWQPRGARLAAVHAAGAVHRDVKPENILITSDQVVKLMDFGIARTFDRTSTLTETGVFLGTPRYASPEQRLGLEVTSAADLYALGVMLFEAATGRQPADNTETADMAAPLASSVSPEVSPFLDEVLAQLLSWSPRERFGSAEVLADTLEKAEERRGGLGARGSRGTRRPQIRARALLPDATARSGGLCRCA